MSTYSAQKNIEWLNNHNINWRDVQITNGVNNVDMSSFTNINWRDVQRNDVVNNVDRSSLREPWQNSPYKS